MDLSEYVEWYLNKHYSKEEIHTRNNKYYNLRLDKVDELLKLEMNFNNACDISFNILQ